VAYTLTEEIRLWGATTLEESECMGFKPNILRQKLAEGELVLGGALYSWSPNVTEVAGYAGLDFIRIDCEHTWRQDSSAEHLLRAAQIADVVPIMRIDRDNPYLIRKALEIGAGGILIPNITRPEEVIEVVEASKFPPRGIRGYSSNCWSAGWGAFGGEEWVKWSDTEPLIGVMIENTRAVDGVDEILSIEGIDFAYFGPADYSMSLGLGKPDREDVRVQEALTKTIGGAKKAGKHIMMNPGIHLEEIRKYIHLGVTMLEIGKDLEILHEVWAGLCSELGSWANGTTC
jgi:4-hydroxy-2-oxoheptanedioate aldolase